MATFSVQIANNADDGIFSYPTDTQFYPGASTLNFGHYSSNAFSTFILFRNITIAQGSTISAAKVTFISASNRSTTTVNTTIYANAVDNPATPSSATELQARPLTTANVTWNSIPAWTAESSYDTPDITSIIQEIINRPGWVSGNSILLFVFDTGSSVNAYREPYIHNSSAAKSANLQITYIASTTPVSSTDSGTLTGSETSAVKSTESSTDSGTINALESGIIQGSSSSADSGTLAGSEASNLVIIDTKSSVDSGNLTATETSSLAITYYIYANDSGVLTGVETLGQFDAAVNTVDSGTLDVSELASLMSWLLSADIGTISAAETLSILAQMNSVDSGVFTGIEQIPQIRQISTDEGTIQGSESSVRKIVEITVLQRIRVDITDKDGNKVGFGPQAQVISAQYTLSLDEIGTFELSIPASLESAQYYKSGYRVSITREGEGEVFRGIIGNPEIDVNVDNTAIMTIAGDSTSRELVWANTLLARAYSNEDISDIIDDLLTGTTWTLGTLDGSGTLTARYDGASIWSALSDVASSTGRHIREDNLTSTVDMFIAGDSSGQIIRNVDSSVPGGMAIIPITGIKITENESEIWNRIIPLGAGVANNVLTLEHATLSSPYTVQTLVGPDGSTIWYIEDTDSQDEYDVRTKILKVDDIAPISNSSAEIENAANTLYTVASAWLGWNSVQKDTYEVDVIGLKHLGSSGTPIFKLGQTFRLQYRGIVENQRGKYVWKDIDNDLYLMKMQRSFEPTGADKWVLTLATVDQFGDDNPITKAINDLWALQTALKPYTYMEQHGPVRLTADSSHTFQMNVEFDENVTYIHRAILSGIKRTIRSNVAGAAGGGSHSHTISGSTSGSGGGQTSSGGTSHSHAINSSTTLGEAAPGHQHEVAIGSTITAWTDPAYQQLLIFEDINGNTYGVTVGRNGTTGVNTALWSFGWTPHAHTINSQTSQSESSHTHSVSNHTHTISGSTSSTVTNHTHSMTYGIYEGPSASSPGFHLIINSVDVTTDLGGPWDSDFEVDITPYFTDVNGLLLRQKNDIQVSTTQLCDLEVTVRSLMSAMAVVPV